MVIFQALQSALRGDSENVSCWEALADAYMARSVARCCHNAAIIFMSRPSFSFIFKNMVLNLENQVIPVFMVRQI